MPRSHIRKYLTDAYATLDPRSLAVGRIALALVLLLDLASRAIDLTAWYSNDGLLPNHTMLWRPWTQYVFSPFFMASWTHEAAIGFVICAAAYLLLLVGYRTKLAQVASWLCVLALHGRTQFVQNGGDVVLGILALWTAFLPMGRRFSVDSMIRRMRAHREATSDDLADRSAFAPDDRPVVSLAATALLLQLFVIYLFNALHKDGVTWRDGSVVHYVLHQDRIVTWLGVWARERLTPLMSQVLTYSAIAIEFTLPAVLMLPFGRKITRTAAVLLVWMLHGGFIAFINLGTFAPVMMAFALPLLPRELWDGLARLRARRPRLRAVIFDADCGVCFAMMRVLARLDSLGRLRLVAGDAPEAADVPADLRAQTIVVRSLDGRLVTTRAAALRELGRCVPALAPLGWLLALPGAIAIGDRLYDAFAARRTAISQRLGLAACGVGGRAGAPPVTAAATVAPDSGKSSILASIREQTVLALMLLAFGQLITENRAMRGIISWAPPRPVRAAVAYLQLFQGWSMFAPEAPKQDFNVVVDAVTTDGRHVDPFNEVASPGAPTPGFSSPRALGQDWLFCDYIVGIAWKREYHQAFIDWVLRHPERTGRPADAIKSFEAFVVKDDSPPPGQTEPTNVRTERFLSWP